MVKNNNNFGGGISRRRKVRFNDDSTQIHHLESRTALENKQRWYKSKQFSLFIEEVYETVSKVYIEGGDILRNNVNENMYCLRGLEGYSPNAIETRENFVRDILLEQKRYRSINKDFTVRLSALSLSKSRTDKHRAMELAKHDAKEAMQILLSNQQQQQNQQQPQQKKKINAIKISSSKQQNNKESSNNNYDDATSSITVTETSSLNQCYDENDDSILTAKSPSALQPKKVVLEFDTTATATTREGQSQISSTNTGGIGAYSW